MNRFFSKIQLLALTIPAALLLAFYVSQQNPHQNRAPNSSSLSVDASLLAPEVSPKAAWEFLNTSPYDRDNLPFQEVSHKDFYSAGVDLLLKDSKRTVKSSHHFIPYQRKLIFPMGVCLRGLWSIDEHNSPYTGYFRPKTKGVIIARAATSLDRIYYGEYRTLALSGKIFPTTDSLDETPLPAANFLLMNNNTGELKEYFTESHLTNAAPTTINVSSVALALIGYRVGQAFNLADKRRDMRQLYQIAELDDKAPYSSPKWMVLQGNKKFQKLSHEIALGDYRQEIMEIIDRNETLELEIFISSELKNNQPVYERIGSVAFDEYAASKECDRSLHFQHPPYLEKYDAPAIDQDLYENKTLD